jgi:hypothetical protein
MGLDMYLNAKRYMSKYFNEGDEAKMKLIAEVFPELANRKGCFGDASPVKEVRIEAGYWRKANAVHDWFVRNVQEGEDDCGNYHVSREQLEELKELCKQVLEDRERASELLPTTDGFFFGSTEYDQHYFDDLEKTIRIIDDCLTLHEQWEFEYHSSW